MALDGPAVGSEEGDNVEVTKRELVAPTTSVEAGGGAVFVAWGSTGDVEVEGVEEEVDEGDANLVEDEGVAGVAEDEGDDESLDVEAADGIGEGGNVLKVPTVMVGRIVVELG